VKPDVLLDEDVARWMQGKFGKIVAYTRSREREAQRDADYEHEQNTIREIFEEIEKWEEDVADGRSSRIRIPYMDWQSLKDKYPKESA